MIKIAKYVLYDLVRNRFVVAFTIFLMAVTFSLFSLDSDSGKSTLSLLNIVLLAVPLVSVVFSTIHFFNSYEFIALLLAQPIPRKTIFVAEFGAVTVALSLAFLIGVGLPLLSLNFSASAVYLVGAGVLLTLVFVALGFASAIAIRDKARAIGVALLFWFYFTLLYDGFVLYIIYGFSDYPLEKLTLGLVSLNPVDLARILILLKLDISALMGYTGAFYRNFFGGSLGSLYSFLLLSCWIALPLWLALRKFLHKDF